MRLWMLLVLLLSFSFGYSQMYNAVPNYVYNNQLGVGRSSANDSSAYLHVGPMSGATKGVLLPRVSDTNAVVAKKNGLLIYSIQLNSIAIWDSLSIRWNPISFSTSVSGGGGGGGSDSVLSVFGRKGNVVAQSGDYNTSLVPESGNLYFTQSRARQSINAISPVIYDSALGRISVDTTILSTKANAKRVVDSAFALVTTTSRSSISATAPVSYNSSTGVISMSAANATTNGYLTSTDWSTFNSKQGAITLTTTGSSGASTFSSNTLNIPNYTLTGLGGVPTTRTITINSVAQDLSANRSWSVGTVTSVGTSYGLSGGTITTSGTLSADSSLLSTKLWRQKGIDSLVPLITAKEPTIAAGTTAQYWRGDKSWQTLNTTAVPEGTNQYFTSARVYGLLSAVSPMQHNGSGVFSMSVANSTNSGYLTSTDWNTFNNKQGTISTTLPISISANNISIAQATISQNGYLSSTDFNNFNNKQSAISLTTNGNVGASTFSSNVLNIPRIDTSLLSTRAWRQKAVDSIIPLINAKEGTIAAGTTAQYWRGDKSWQTLNSSVVPEGTNLYYTDARARASVSATAPLSYTSSTGVFGISQATTSTNGFLSSTDWNTFNGKQGTITLTTLGNVGASSFASNVLNIPRIDTTLLDTRAWRQKGLDSLAPLKENVITAGTTAQYWRGDKSWQSLITTNVPEGTNLYYTDARVRSSITASTPLSLNATTGVLTLPQATISQSGFLNATDFNTFNNKQAPITLTTTGNSGAATFSSNTLNIPNYTLAGLGGITSSRLITINGVSQDLSADRTFNVGSVTSVATNASTGITGGTITSSGTLSIDTTLLTTRAWRKKGDDSLAVLINAKGSGTVTSIATSYGLTGGTITSSGTLTADSSVLATKLWRQKGVDSVVSIIPSSARASISLTTTGTSGAATYNSFTGVLNIPSYNATGTVSSVGTGVGLLGGPITTVGTISADTLTLSTRLWLRRSMDSINSAFAGKENTIAAGITSQYWRGDKSWQTLNTTAVAEGTNLYYTDARARASHSVSAPLTYNSSTGLIGIGQASTSTNGFLSSTDWNTFNGKQSALTLTTTGASGAATLTGGALNIPNYTLTGLGGVPTTRSITINGVAQDLSANRSYSVGTVTSVANGFGTTGGTITSSGTIAVDTFSVSTKAYRQKAVDSINTILTGLIAGTALDTLNISTRAWRQKAVDSLIAVLQSKPLRYSLSDTITSVTPPSASDISYFIRNLASGITFNPGQSVTLGSKLFISIKDNGISRAISFLTNAFGGFYGGDISLPTSTTVGKTLYLGFICGGFSYGLCDPNLIPNNCTSYPNWHLIAKVEVNN